MLNRRDNGSRSWLVISLALAGAVFAAGVAFAASQTIVGTGTNTYTATSYTTDQGEVVPFEVTGSMHNVTADTNGPDGRTLFRSATISGGTTQVNGTQYLMAGNYVFHCTIHPTMTATLHVTTSGTPQPRPNAALSLRSRKISKAAKKGLLVAITASAKIDGASLVAKLGNTTIGSAGGLSLAPGQSFQVVKLTKSGKSKLRGRRKAAITVTADIPFGAPATARGKLS